MAEQTPMTVLQLDLFPPPAPPPQPFKRGWTECDCGICFWEWPITGRPPGKCTGEGGAPDLRQFRFWTCWRGLKRATPESRKLNRELGAE